jgi:hypothetical protein
MQCANHPSSLVVRHGFTGELIDRAGEVELSNNKAHDRSNRFISLVYAKATHDFVP